MSDLRALIDELRKPPCRNTPDQLIEYTPDVELQSWLQRISRTLILSLLGLVLLSMLCQGNPFLKEALYAFFRWVLIPIKPMLMSEPSAALAGVVFWLSLVCNVSNLIAIPTVALLAVRTGRLPDYIYLQPDRILILRIMLGSPENFKSHRDILIDGRRYAVLKSIPVSENTELTIERPRGTKSTRDYVLKVACNELQMRIRWGDIVRSDDRDLLLHQLEATFPRQIDQSVFEPFKQIPKRQSYTELWLKELSGAPKRDKLTPLADGSQMDKGSYTVVKKAGVGGQGTVYLATSAQYGTGEQQLVVLKEFVLPVYPDLRVRKKAAERFQSEASMLGRLNHPQIARFFDLFVEDHRGYLVLEHVEGTTLKDMVAAQGPLAEQQAIEVAVQIALILEYLHGQDPPVVHRDLTPDNIMYGKEGLIKLIDFSVAQQLSYGITGSVVGKPNYIAPEQFRGKPTTMSDIYSFGATMFYLLTGADPPPISILHPQAENAAISPAFDAIIARCTQLDLDKRYERADQLLADLKDCQSNV